MSVTQRWRAVLGMSTNGHGQCRRAPGPRSANARTVERWCEPPKPWRSWLSNLRDNDPTGMLCNGPVPGPKCSRTGLADCAALRGFCFATVSVEEWTCPNPWMDEAFGLRAWPDCEVAA